MAPVVTVLQLDTGFPRVPGDVGCANTYLGEIEILRIDGATVGQIVSDRPDLIDIAPFENAMRQARGAVIVTSCGFLSYWQGHLAALTTKPFISSSLIAFDTLSEKHTPNEILTVTFDAHCLTPQHFRTHAAYASGVVGLLPEMHLRRVILDNIPTLDETLAQAELVDFVKAQVKPHHKHIVFECTNLPPYKAAIKEITELAITDILTCIEDVRPGTIRPEFV